MKVKFKQYNCILEWGRYADDSIAIQLMDQEGPVATATVRLYDPPPPKGWDPKTEVWLKDWSENRGMVEALVKAGVVEVTGKLWPAGYVTAVHAKLTPIALAELARVQV